MPIRNFFTKSPLSESSINLIDLEPGTFLDTEEDINVMSAAIWVMCVQYERLDDKEKPKVRDDLRKVSCDRIHLCFLGSLHPRNPDQVGIVDHEDPDRRRQQTCYQGGTAIR